jgi:hypothetical protein
MSLINGLRQNLNSKILYKVLLFLAVRSLFVRKNAPLSLLMRSLTETLPVYGHTGSGRAIICFSRELFRKDFAQLVRYDHTYNWIWFDKNYSLFILDRFLPEEFKKQKGYLDSIARYPHGWSAAVKYFENIITILERKKLNVACYITGNIDYWQDHAFKVACRKLNIPVLVLQKEFPVTSVSMTSFVEWYRNTDPIADFVLVAGERAKVALEECGTTRFCGVTVTGLPRFDVWLKDKATADHVRSNEVLIVSFRTGYGANSEEFFFETCFLTQKAVRGMSPITIKAKNEKDAEYIERFLKKRKYLGTFNVVWKEDLALYLKKSSIIITQNSLGTIEALFTRAIIIFPLFRSTGIGKIVPENFLGQKIVTYAETIESFCGELKRVILNNAQIDDAQHQARIAYIRSYMRFDFYESASKRVLKVIDELSV